MSNKENEVADNLPTSELIKILVLDLIFLGILTYFFKDWFINLRNENGLTLWIIAIPLIALALVNHLSYLIVAPDRLKELKEKRDDSRN